MRIFTVLLPLLLASRLANAMWMEFPETELIARSELIVLATVADTPPTRLSDTQSTLLLRVSERLKGPGVGEVRLAVPAADAPRSSTDISYRPGQQGLWFLRAGPAGSPDGVYWADQPQRFIPVEQSGKIEHFRHLLRTAPAR